MKFYWSGVFVFISLGLWSGVPLVFLVLVALVIILIGLHRVREARKNYARAILVRLLGHEEGTSAQRSYERIAKIFLDAQDACRIRGVSADPILASLVPFSNIRDSRNAQALVQYIGELSERYRDFRFESEKESFTIAELSQCIAAWHCCHQIADFDHSRKGRSPYVKTAS